MKARNNALDISMYVRPAKGQEKPNLQDESAKLVWTMFQKTAASINMQLRGKYLPWPASAPVDDTKISTDKGVLPTLEDPEHDADAAVLLLENLNKVGPQLSDLLTRKRKKSPLHVFITSLEPLPENPDSYRALRSLPLRYSKSDGLLLQPEPEPFMRNYDLEEAGLLSFHDLQSLSGAKTRQRICELLQYMQFVKII